MKRLVALLIVSALAAVAQSSETALLPQTARQALIEMFFSKTPGTLVKHLPAATLGALAQSGKLATLQQYSLLAGQFEAKGKTLETFETGSTLLAVDDPQSNQKFEIRVDNDSLQGDDDNIDLSFQSYKDKQLKRTPFLPRLTFVMKMESGVWKLNEIRLTVRLPLADPDFLKSIAEGTKAQTATAVVTQPRNQTSTTAFGTDTSIVAAMRTILAAENTYSGTYRSTGYTCTLSDLDGFGGGEPNEHQAMLIASGLAGGKKYGYVFTLSACGGTPANSFHLMAAPGGNSFGRRAFCADQAGAIRYSTDGNPTTCLAAGVPVQ